MRRRDEKIHKHRTENWGDRGPALQRPNNLLVFPKRTVVEEA